MFTNQDLQDVQSCLDKYEYRGIYKLLQTKVYPSLSFDKLVIWIHIKMIVPERETEELIEISDRFHLYDSFYCSYEQFIERALSCGLKNLLHHEHDEGFWKDGKIIHDPHDQVH